MKRNYYMFGDVISFDATYKRNKYNMMFVPFTGIDNHNRNVTLGAAILGSEMAETYSWLLKAIKNAYGYAPPVIVTDQDPAMKRAIADVWPESRHRLCMWHIMDKLTTKVGATLCSNTYFRKRLSAVVWTDSLLPEAFETEWAAILNDFGLTDHEWLTYIYTGYVNHGFQLSIVKKKRLVLYGHHLGPKARITFLARLAIQSARWLNFLATSTQLLKRKDTSIEKTIMTLDTPTLESGVILFSRSKQFRYIPELYFLCSTRDSTCYLSLY
ncbi:putative MULE transposase domain, FHY3/FAR1 family [Helianthus annuus]|nr:putative MULE transposase domain, FHY3/FAR1 family [Helianthus annuus]